MLLVLGRQEWGSSSTHISPLLNRVNHSKTCVRLSASSLKAFSSISCASVAVFPRWKQNLKQIRCSVRSDITISRKELDSTWENWQHQPIQPSTATSAWVLTCAVGPGATTLRPAGVVQCNKTTKHCNSYHGFLSVHYLVKNHRYFQCTG